MMKFLPLFIVIAIAYVVGAKFPGVAQRIGIA